MKGFGGPPILRLSGSSALTRAQTQGLCRPAAGGIDRAFAVDGEAVGRLVASRRQDDPAEMYLQDVMTDP
ncbi:hypothetical protein [Micromonospora sp. NPDC005113]